MKKILISVFVIQIVFVATFAYAECIEPTKIVGSWKTYVVQKDLFPDEQAISAKMAALEAGESKIEELTSLDPGISEFVESGEMKLDMFGLFSPEQTLRIKVTGTWKLECEKLIGEITSLDDVEMGFTEKASEEFKTTMEPQMKEFAAGFKEQAMEQPGFAGPHTWLFPYIGEKYVLVDIGDERTYVIYEKK
jgi:hypothetical protein